MRRTISALVAAGLLVAVLAGTTSAAPHKHGGRTSVGGASFVTTACVDAQNEMVFRVDWAHMTIDQSQVLAVTWTLKGRGLPATQVGDLYSPTFDDPSYAISTSAVLVGPKGPVAWKSWRTIEASATGAFSATAKTIHRPGRAWPAC